MAIKKGFEEKLDAVGALRKLPPEEAAPALKKALAERNNYLVSRAAMIAGELGLENLVPDLLSAYERYFVDPVKNDPQCWAKSEALVALKALGHRETETYLRGLNYVQFEPVYTPPYKTDTATKVRGTCAMALIDCRLPSLTVLKHLTPLLADPEAPVRLDAIRAVMHLADPATPVLLRLKALVGDAAPEVLGQCFSAILALEPGTDAVVFLARFLESADTDTQLEAACALAQSGEQSALGAVKEHWETPRPTIEIRRAILLNLGVSPNRAAADFLREIIDGQPRYAEAAREALAASRFATDDER